jgi:hypothetical protein
LTATEGLGRVDVGGPETLSASDVVLLVNEVFGVSITLQDVSDEQREAGLLAAGVAAPIETSHGSGRHDAKATLTASRISSIA